MLFLLLKIKVASSPVAVRIINYPPVPDLKMFESPWRYSARTVAVEIGRFKF